VVIRGFEPRSRILEIPTLPLSYITVRRSAIELTGRYDYPFLIEKVNAKQIRPNVKDINANAISDKTDSNGIKCCNAPIVTDMPNPKEIAAILNIFKQI
jgi:hypothetical protein